MGFADIGYQGMVYVGKNTPHMKLLRPFLEKKKVGCPFLLTSTSVRVLRRPVIRPDVQLLRLAIVAEGGD